MKKTLIDLAGQRFGRLVVLHRAPNKDNKHKRAVWRCLCDCGTERSVTSNNLRGGITSSCGCLRLDAITTHGMSGAPGYGSWKAMLNRCTNPDSKDWPRYGGKGIECRFEGFEHFLSVIGPKPSSEYTVDRYPNQKGHYEPGNVRWATHEQQQRNKRNNRMVTHEGRTQCMAAWEQELGLPPGIVSKRLSHGWSVDRALTEPSRSQRAPLPIAS